MRYEKLTPSQLRLQMETPAQSRRRHQALYDMGPERAHALTMAEKLVDDIYTGDVLAFRVATVGPAGEQTCYEAGPADTLRTLTVPANP